MIISDFLKKTAVSIQLSIRKYEERVFLVDQICCCLGHQHQGWVPSPEGDRVLVMFPQRIFPSFTYRAVHYLFSSVLMLFHKSCYTRSFSLTVFLALEKSKLSQIPFLLGGYWQFVKLTDFSRAKDKPHIQTVNTPTQTSFCKAFVHVLNLGL